MQSDPTRLPPASVPRHAGLTRSWAVRPELLDNPDPNFAESARRVGLNRSTLYNWFRPTFAGHVVVKALLSHPALTLPEVARRMWVTPRTVRAWFPLSMRVQLVRFWLLHSKLYLSQVVHRLGGGDEALDAWLPPEERWRIAKEVLRNPDPNFAESARRVGLSRKSLYNWFPPTFAGHVVVKALLSRAALTLPEVARRLHLSPAVVHAWFPHPVKLRLVKFLLLRADFSLAQIARRLGLPLDTVRAWFSPDEWSQLARRLLLSSDLRLSHVAQRIGVSPDALRDSFSPKQRFRLVRRLLLRSELSLAELSRRIGVSRRRLHLQWLPRQHLLHIATDLLLFSRLSLAQITRRLDLPPETFWLQGLPPIEQHHFVRALVVHTNLPPIEMAWRLVVPMKFLLRWIPNLKLKGTEMTNSRVKKKRRVGYARVSTLDQDPQHQITVLKAAGCCRIFTDNISGAAKRRPALDDALRFLNTGDTLVVWSFDRLGRSLQHLIEIVNNLAERGVGLESLTQRIDTNTPLGKMVFSIMGSLAEFERNLISERTKLAAARRREKKQKWGRPSSFHDPERVKLAQRLLRSDLPKTEVARRLGMSPVALYRWFPKGDPDRFGEGPRGAGLPDSLRGAASPPVEEV